MANYGFRKDGTELKTQVEVVLYYLQEAPGVNRITSGYAWNEFGFSRLSSIVKKIEKKYGIVLQRRYISVKNRYGGECHVTEYWYDAA